MDQFGHHLISEGAGFAIRKNWVLVVLRKSD